MFRLSICFPAKTASCLALLICVIPCEAKKVDFTYDLARSLSVDELKALQFYSKGLYLIRNVSAAGDRVASSTLVTRSGKVYEIVMIKPGTPGLLTAVSDSRNRISVSFEPGCSLEYQINGTGLSATFVPSDNSNVGTRWYSTSVRNPANIPYCGFLYQIGWGLINRANQTKQDWDRRIPWAEKPKHSWSYSLVVDVKHEADIVKNSRVAPGRRVGTP